MKDFPNKLKHKNFERIKPYFNYFGLRSLNISNYTLSDDSISIINEQQKVINVKKEEWLIIHNKIKNQKNKYINGIFDKRTEELNIIASFKTRAVCKRNTLIK